MIAPRAGRPRGELNNRKKDNKMSKIKKTLEILIECARLSGAEILEKRK